jgi:hypothetical protein
MRQNLENRELLEEFEVEKTYCNVDLCFDDIYSSHDGA